MGGILESSGFKIQGSDEEMFLNDDGQGNVRMYYLVSGVKTYQNNTQGTINYTTGQITLTSLNIASISNIRGSASTVIELTVKPDLTLIDGSFAPSDLKNYKTIINGDEKVKVISAASIIAKVYRDNLMIKLSEKFSNYAWESNFGYGTKAHLDGLKKYGVTSHHRKGFKPIHKILSN